MSIKLNDGSIIRHGQLIRRAGLDAPRGFGRSFKPKEYATPALAGGMRDVSATGHPLGFVGGKRPLDDEPNSKLHIGKGSPPLHDGMRTRTPECRGADYGPDHASKLLADAGYGSYASPVAAKHGAARLRK